jgi:energy-coupling factor transporter ATP-binding protein EcfA2
MRVTKILLRWYKSFNTRFHGYHDENGSLASWDKFAGKEFPFIEIPVDRQITTIVGANESGKSHLLSALAKVFTGFGIGDDSKNAYAIQDICRYCAFKELDQEIWPYIGVELCFDSSDEFAAFCSAIEITHTSSDGNSSPPRCTAIMSGGTPERYVALHLNEADSPAGHCTKAKWEELTGTSVPALRFIDAKIALANEIHVNQLLSAYEGKQPAAVYDPIALQNMASLLEGLSLEAGKPVDKSVVERISTAKSELSTTKIAGPKGVALEALLFRDVLKIEKSTLERIQKLGTSNRGYVERLISEINHRLDEALDLTHFWEQDDEFKLSIDFKSGFFYFEITDKTDAKYTFNERSSGLRYFLSYYIQAKAIEQANEERGSIVLMDEPDSFLSVSGQRNLLQVFESLVSPKSSSGSCQLIYTTHSPFLINRNFPKRICLVRKGDGSEGTQFVPSSGIRRYEPIRSALGVDCSETLFMGATNIVVEGLSDQRALVSGIQRFGSPSDVDDLLNLNTVTFVSAGGASHVKRLVQKSTSGDEKRPIVVVLLDGDEAGLEAHTELTYGSEPVLEAAFVATLDTISIDTPWTTAPKVIEDIIPPKMLAVAASRYLKERWDESVEASGLETIIKTTETDTTACDRMVKAVTDKLGTEAKRVTGEEVKSQIHETFHELLLNDGNDFDEDSLKQLKHNVHVICEKLRDMIDEAHRRSKRDSLHKCVRLTVASFLKAHHRGASRADVERNLASLQRESTGFTPEARGAREQLNELSELLHTEVAKASDSVDMAKWTERLNKFSQCPWKKPKSGW